MHPIIEHCNAAANALRENLGWLDHSHIRCAAACLRKFYYRYVLGLTERIKPEALRFGRAIHLGTKAIREGQPLKAAQERFVEAFEESPEGFRSRALGCALLAQYAEWWRNCAHELVVIGEQPANEIGFAVPYSESLVVKGRFDALIRDKDYGTIRVLDDKTTSRLGGTFWRGWETDGQLSCYILAARSIVGSEAIDSAVVVALHVSKNVLPRTIYAGTKRERHKEGERGVFANIYSRSEWALETHRQDFIHHAEQVISRLERSDFWKEELWPRTTTACVSRWQRMCPYAMFCQEGLASFSETVILTDFEVRPWDSWEEES